MKSPWDYVQARADLVRVARLCGVPEGHAPSRPQYTRHGRWSETRIRGMWGYRPLPRRNRHGHLDFAPVLGWRATVQRFGLRPHPAWGKPRQEVLDDVYRVWGILGRSPSVAEYKRLGRYGYQTVMRRFGATAWAEVRRALDGDGKSSR